METVYTTSGMSNGAAVALFAAGVLLALSLPIALAINQKPKQEQTK